MLQPVVILGCGYTGRYVATGMLARGHRVIATSRRSRKAPVAGVEVVLFEASEPGDLSFVPPSALVLYSIPTLDPDPTPEIISRVSARKPARLVYLSTTSVYGAAAEVDEYTKPAPRSSSEVARVRAERAVLGCGCSAMVLRPAAIYGPDRGVHVKMAQGKYQMAGDGSNYVSRIHVEDLASLTEAALLSDEGGAWPVADDEPCTSREIAAFCSETLGLPMPPSVSPDELHSTRRADRRVNGAAVRRLLGVRLRYSSYRQGILASASPQSEP